MKMRSTLIAFALLLSLPGFAQKAEIEELIKPYTETNNFSGSVLIARDSKTIFSKAYGQINRSYNLPNTPQSKFYLASVSMIFTAVATMKLVDEKKISVDDRVSKYLPDYNWGDQLTVHHLLSQRSGIPPIGNNGKVDYDSITKFTHTIDQLIRYFKNDSLLFAPGSQYNHGRSDYIILAYIIEKVTGKKFGDYLKEIIFEPLHMTNTAHSNGEKEIVPNLAQGYAALGYRDVEIAYQIDWTSKTGHASIYSTPEDLNKFSDAILKGQLLFKESWQKVFTNYGNNMGYACSVGEHLGRKRFQLTGRSPGFTSYMGIYPDDRLTVVVLSNYYISAPSEMGKQLVALKLGVPFERVAVSAIKISPEKASRLTGRYRFDNTFYVKNMEMEVSYADGNLSCTWGALIPVTGGQNKFKNRNFWADVQFTDDAMLIDGYKGVSVSR